jgi:hypothetical protein
MNKWQLARRAYRALEEELYTLPPVSLTEVANELDCAQDDLYWALQDVCEEGVAEFLYNCAKDMDIAILAVGSALSQKYNNSDYWKEAFSLVQYRLKEKARRHKAYWRLIDELRSSGQLGDYEP